MPKRYSIAEARQSLAAIVHELEAQPLIEITRRGEPVAVLLSLEAYRRLQGEPQSFWDAYTAYRATLDPADLEGIAAAFDAVREPSPGRDVQL